MDAARYPLDTTSTLHTPVADAPFSAGFSDAPRSALYGPVRRHTAETAAADALAADTQAVFTDAETHATRESTWFVASDKAELFSVRWNPPGAIHASIIAFHGLGEHIMRYDAVFLRWAQHGYRIIGFDQRGFGQTGQRRTVGHNEGLRRVMKDALELADAYALNDAPLHAFGHSMGGFLALHFAALHPQRVASVAASGPLILRGSNAGASIVKDTALRVLAPLLRTVVMKNPLTVADVSRDPAVVADFEADPLCHAYVSVGTAYDIVTGGEGLNRNPNQVTVPCMIAHGTADRMTDPTASQRFIANLAIADKRYVPLDGLYHEILFEPEKEWVSRSFLDWFDEHTAPRTGSPPTGTPMLASPMAF